jgi:nitroreductase
MNRQPWRFSVVTNRSTIRRLSDESKNNLLADLEADPASPIRRYEDLLRNPAFNVFYDAPCVIYISGLARWAACRWTVRWRRRT